MRLRKSHEWRVTEKSKKCQRIVNNGGRHRRRRTGGDALRSIPQGAADALPVFALATRAYQRHRGFVGEGSLGYSVLYASTQLLTDNMFALVLTETVLGLGFLFLVKFLEWYF